MPKILGVPDADPNPRVLVVDRAKPHPFYDERAEIRTSGATCRSVPNMAEVHEAISRETPADLVTLEDMSLREQIFLFRTRSTFVMQHGAAMGNLLWAPKGSLLMEIRSAGQEDYFAQLVQLLQISRKVIPQDNNHAPVKLEEVRIPKAA